MFKRMRGTGRRFIGQQNGRRMPEIEGKFALRAAKIFVVIAWLLGAGVLEAAVRELAIPEPLKPWKDWVLHDFDQAHCPFLYRAQTYECIWVERSELVADAKGLDFRIDAELFAPRWLTLPGNDDYWPINVQRISQPRSQIKQDLAVRALDGRPQVYLTPGTHRLSGRIPWRGIPANLPMPGNSGLVSVRLEGETVHHPEIDNGGYLWLKKTAEETVAKERDSQNIQVFRLLRDDNPATLVTRVILDISGAPRELKTGDILLEDFAPLELRSALPARIEEDKSLRVQVRPGRWEIELVARHQGPLNAISFSASDDLWPATEVWAFAANRSLRTVQIEGGLSVDPRQTNLPQEWAEYPAFRVTADQSLTLYQVHRGDPNPEADALQLRRDIYLDFSGTGYTISDAINGQVNQSWRLDTDGDYLLGRVSLNGQPQLITSSPQNEAKGVELRRGEVNMHAAGRHGFSSEILISGWQQAFDKVQATIHLPPGWSLLATAGVDSVNASWVSRWSLLDIFLVLIIVVAVFRLAGAVPATLALVTLLLLYHRANAPLFIWLNLVGVLALLKVTEGALQRWLKRYQLVSFALLAIMLIPFSAVQLREAIYPQLEPREYRVHDFRTPLHDDVVMEGEALVSKPKVRLNELDMNSVELQEDSFADVSRRTRKPTPLTVRQEYDPNAIVQTGPGLPRWYWNSANLSWGGPVAQGEAMHLYFAPPWLNRLGNILAVLCSVVFAAFLLQCSHIFANFKLLPTKFSQTALSCLAVALFLGLPSERVQAGAQVSPEMLQQLQERLLASPKCLPQCASIASVAIRVQDNQLSIDMHVDANDDVAFVLPAWQQHWLPHTVSVLKGKSRRPATIKMGPDGQMMVRLTTGRHRLTLEGDLYGDRVELPFTLPVHNVSTELNGWEVSGVKDGLAKTGSIQLSREEKRVAQRDVLLPDPAPPFVQVNRKLVLGLEWKVLTTVTRIAPAHGALSVRIPLLSGESPISDVNLDENTVTVDFSPQQNEVQWQSILLKQETIELEAAQSLQWSERWALEASPIWHISYEGLAPIKQTGALHTPVWQPWTGEKVSISVVRPAAVEGKSLTIDEVRVEHQLGARSNTTEVNFSVRTSRGQDFPFNLPEKAVFESLLIDGQAQPLRQLSNKIEIPLRPGEQQIQIKWRSDDGVQLLSRIPHIQFSEEINNINISMKLPRERWPLFVGGPLLGPAVLLWGVLIVVAFIAVIFAKIPLTPLKMHDWLLLGVGVVSTNVFSPLFIAAWLFAIGWRGKHCPAMTLGKFRLLQVLLIVFSVLALLLLLSTIPTGLLSRPDMHITGNQSSAFDLHWYQDRSEALVPNAWVFSMPIFGYRLAMLCWSLWLAVVLLRWLKWAWLQLNCDGFWQFERAVVKEKTTRASKPLRPKTPQQVQGVEDNPAKE